MSIFRNKSVSSWLFFHCISSDTIIYSFYPQTARLMAIFHSMTRLLGSSNRLKSCHSVAFLLKTNSRNMSTTNGGYTTIKVENLLIIGCGLMGSGIAQVSAASGKFKSIVLQDVSKDQLEKAKSSIHSSLVRVQKKDPSVDPDKIVSGISFKTDVKDEGIGNGLLIIEAVPEKLDLKQNLFKQLYSTYGTNQKVILATNTSSLPCREIGVNIPNKDRFAGLHFFNPVAVMKLVEIIRVDNGTNDETYNALVQFVKDIKKVSVIYLTSRPSLPSFSPSFEYL